MNESKTVSKNPWQKTPVPNLVRRITTDGYFARIRVKGKLIRRNLKTKTLSVAKLRLGDFEKSERQMAEHALAYDGGKMLFADALAIFRQRLQGDASLKPRTKEHREERISVIIKKWTGLEKMDVRKITKQDCLMWAASYKTSPSNFNKTVQTLRLILDIPVEAGIRFENPAKFIKQMKVGKKTLHLPSRVQFYELVKSVRAVNKRFSNDAANLIEFLAYGGFRKNEAANITWADCDFERGKIILKGDPETGLKARSVGEHRDVPMIPEMRRFLEQLKTKRPNEAVAAKVMRVAECNGALANVCRRLEISHITHHDLRHLFATTCIESGVDIPTISRWLGHKDGGALAMKTYGHLRDQHSTDMAQKVVFLDTPITNTGAAAIDNSPNSKPANGHPQKKTAAQAKAAYVYPWWAASEAIEVFWGQANEPVQIVPSSKYLQSAKTAMGREVFEQELNEPQTLLEELAERVGASVIEKLKSKISSR
jgi:integrase